MQLSHAGRLHWANIACHGEEIHMSRDRQCEGWGVPWCRKCTECQKIRRAGGGGGGGGGAGGRLSVPSSFSIPQLSSLKYFGIK